MGSEEVEAAMGRWGDAVWRLCLARLRHRLDAEDAFQETFLALLRAAPTFESDEHEKAWLLRCACNCTNDVFRSRKRHRALSLDDAGMSGAAGAAAGAVEAASEMPPGMAADAELASALRRLTDSQRVAVHLYYYEGYSVEEIARITAQKGTTVRSHLHRARKALKKELEASAPCETTR